MAGQAGFELGRGPRRLHVAQQLGWVSGTISATTSSMPPEGACIHIPLNARRSIDFSEAQSRHSRSGGSSFALDWREAQTQAEWLRKSVERRLGRVVALVCSTA